MHKYMGEAGRDSSSMDYLFSFQGFSMGFTTYDVSYGRPRWLSDGLSFEERRNLNKQRGYVETVIRGIGTPVFNSLALLARDENGDFIYDKSDTRWNEKGTLVQKKVTLDERNSFYVDGFTWVMFYHGERKKFPSALVRDGMKAIWLALFSGLRAF